MKPTFLLLALAASQLAGAQPTPGPGVLTGAVVDAETGAPLPSASVALYLAADSSFVTGAATGADGRFRFDGLAAGGYRVRASFVGYRVVRRDTTVGRGAVDLGALALLVSDDTLDGAEVVAERAAVEQLADRTVYNVADQPITTGGSALDALQTIPSVDVGTDGEVSLRGNGNVAIHLNGRPVPITGALLASYLRQISTSQIASIEVIPNPSARYDAQGTGGVINLVLVETTSRGWSGGLTVGGGTAPQAEAGGTVSYQRGRVDATATYGYRYYEFDADGFSERDVDPRQSGRPPVPNLRPGPRRPVPLRHAVGRDHARAPDHAAGRGRGRPPRRRRAGRPPEPGRPARRRVGPEAVAARRRRANRQWGRRPQSRVRAAPRRPVPRAGSQARTGGRGQGVPERHRRRRPVHRHDWRRARRAAGRGPDRDRDLRPGRLRPPRRIGPGRGRRPTGEARGRRRPRLPRRPPAGPPPVQSVRLRRDRRGGLRPRLARARGVPGPGRAPGGGHVADVRARQRRRPRRRAPASRRVARRRVPPPLPQRVRLPPVRPDGFHRPGELQPADLPPVRVSAQPVPGVSKTPSPSSAATRPCAPRPPTRSRWCSATATP